MAIAALATAALGGALAVGDNYMAIAVSRATLISVTKAAGGRRAAADHGRLAGAAMGTGAPVTGAVPNAATTIAGLHVHEMLAPFDERLCVGPDVQRHHG